jgi:hypothetical protein
MPTTWVYDASTRLWSERCELVGGSYDYLPVDQVVSLGGRLYVSSGAKLLEMSKTSYVGIGAELVRERTWPHLIRPNLEVVNYLGLEIACTTGYDGAEGRITLEVSNDGGYLFGTVLAKTLGAVGRRMQRVRWWFLGSSRDRVFRVRVSDPVPVAFHAATVTTR